jgi:hypothetical protein
MLCSTMALVAIHCAAVAQMAANDTVSDWVEVGDYEYFHVVTPENPSALIREAADTFCRCWTQATGRPITASAVNDGRINVWLGAGIITGEMIKRGELDGLSAQGCLIRTYTPSRRYAAKGAQKQLLVAGTTDQATLYGVHTFFAAVFGARWLAPGVAWMNSARSTMLTLELRSDPAFAFRDAGVFAQWKGSDAETFRRGLRLPAKPTPPPTGMDAFTALLQPNTGQPATPAEYGSETGADRIAETLAALIRAGESADPETKARRERAAWPPGTNTWSLNALDWLTPVAAAECGGRDAAEGSPAASVLFTANRIAGRLAGLFPDAPPRIHVLLPPTLRRPPKTLRPAENVVVQLSALDMDFSRPMEDPANAAFADDLRGWAKLGGKIWVLDQAVNGRDPSLPFPNLHTLQSNVLFCAQNGVSGIYALGGASAPDGPADLAEMRAYLWAQILWNPDIAFDDLIREYCDLYYGPAGAAVLECIGMEENAVKASGKPLRGDDAGAWLDAAVVQRIGEKLEAALARPNLPSDIKPRVEAVLASVKRGTNAR